MKGRPRIPMELTRGDIALEVVGWIALFLLWAIVLLNYSNLPETIPTHYGASGIPDNYGSKTSLLMLPVIATILFAGMTYLNRFPHIFNYPVEITQQNAAYQYRKSTQLLRYMKLIVMLIFGFISFQTVRAAHNEVDGLGPWFVPTLLILTVVIPLPLYLILSSRKKR